MRTPSPAAPRRLPALAAALLAACGDPSGPPPTNDPIVVVGRLRVLDSIFGDRLLQVSSVLGLAFQPPREAGRIVADSLLGRTFEWDPGTGHYGLTARSGAPQDGVRHVLYQVTGADPALPLAEIGTTDYHPGTGVTPAVRTVVQGGGPSRGSGFDIRVSAIMGTDAAYLDASGAVRSGGREGNVRARFAIEPDSVRVDIAVDVPARALATSTIVLTRYTTAGSRQDVDFRLHTRGEVMAMQGWIERTEGASGPSYTADVTIYLNGAILATIIGVDDAISFRDADGAVLTGALALSLNSLLRYPASFQGWVGNLVQPSVNLLAGG